MTRAVLLAVLTLCSARVSMVTAAGRLITATCISGQGPQITDVVNVGSLQVQCPEGFNITVQPPEQQPDQANVFMNTDPNGNAVMAISEACPGAKFTNVQGQKVYVVYVSQLPSTPATFFFRCAQENVTSSGEKKPDCFIGVNVAAYSRLGPNTCALPGPPLVFAVKTAAETVEFSCGTGKTLQPNKAGVAYNDSCTEELSLPEDITLIKKELGIYQLRVSKLPAKRLSICFICAARDATTAERCEVRIGIAGSEESGAAPLGTAARAAAALGLTFAALVFLQVC